MKGIKGSKKKFVVSTFQSNYSISNFIWHSSVVCNSQVKAIVHLPETFFPVLHFTISYLFFFSFCLFVCLFASNIHSFIPLACAECDDPLPFSGASSISLCYVLFPTTLPHQLFVHPLSPHLAIYFLVYLSILLFPNSYIMLLWGFYFLPFSVHSQTNIIYLTLLSLL